MCRAGSQQAQQDVSSQTSAVDPESVAGQGYPQNGPWVLSVKWKQATVLLFLKMQILRMDRHLQVLEGQGQEPCCLGRF